MIKFLFMFIFFQGNKLFKETCKLDLKIERNLDFARSREGKFFNNCNHDLVYFIISINAFILVPDMSVWGTLSSMQLNLDYSQYGLILGFLNENLGEHLEVFERPSSFVADPLGEQTVSAREE